ncbi:MAG TPA: rod shape-determining protein MreC [Candidatus Sulfotelmatobacter sp.]|jgi:rod shape-determining protein MreC|nr:rod shape-determining protein MreC [Candidatus Sulfotelmatobacter sp.]
MESVLGRYRNLIILVGVLFLQVLGLAMQVKKSGGDVEKTRLIRIWAVDAVTPLERSLVWLQNGSGSLWHNYFYLRGVRAENRELKQQIEQMRLEQVRLADDAAQARRLQTLLAFKEQFISRTVAAQVIGSSGSDMSRIVYIDKGKNAGIEPDMAVITADGIVGKVLLVYPSVAQVLLINDQSSGVGALLEKSRLQGVLRGTANGEVVLERVMSDEQVVPGETVLTSGGDQIFPKGLPVGTVTRVSSGKDLFLNIKIRPAADLSKLEEVLVLVEKQERQSTTDEGVRMRASDILAQRLPSVPDKAPAASATATLLTNGTPKAAVQPQAANKPANGILAKPQSSVKSQNPTASPAVPQKVSKPLSAASAVHSAPPSNQSVTPPGPPSAAPSSGTQPNAEQANPSNGPTMAPPKPATPEQANPQPPADESKPQ